MRTTRFFPTIDAADPEAEAAFWAAVLGGEVVPDDAAGDAQRRTVVVDGKDALAVQHAPDQVAPTWPEGERPLQMHLDVYVPRDEAEDAFDAVLRLGAPELDGSQSPADLAEGFRVYADPAGMPFCICWD